MLYKYSAKKGTETIEGTIEAQSKSEAIEKLSQSGYIPVRIEKENAFPKAQTQVKINKSPGRITSRQITVFSRELASLLKSGVPILTALDIIREQSENSHLENVLTKVRNAIKDGSAFSSSIAGYSSVFSPLYIAMVKAGEDSGSLPEVLLRITEYRIKEEEMFSKLRIAAAYPVVMAFVGLGTVIFMLTFVLPRLTRIFIEMGRELPLATQILINISQGIRGGWFWIVLIVATVILVIRQQAKTKAGKTSLSLLQLRIPILGKIILKAELARFCRTLELLIKSGIPILRSINIAIPVLQNEVVRAQLAGSYKELEQGGSLGNSLKKSRIFPLFMSNLIIVGEESGKLEGSLAEIAGLYERDTDEAIRIMGSLLEPLMILVMGLIVGFIVVAMLLPIFDISPIR